ncbi:beta-N-acetylhexosaminidase [Virgibacillus phasianinus]|uniref:beta-N-acetylhexosaminidase n=1 Tax=Virgibacillus phasianinus TaxID=2017483 RepID=A0A220U3C3_9BACI|nr:glycoside hydrolase family 3 protein [Virgibacillus phasianinus]ASK62321.1 beta-N-acetylhexosaminidase [Virgibacillus phasianinus]
MKIRQPLLLLFSCILIFTLAFPANSFAKSKDKLVEPDWIQSKMQDMTVEEKVGQLFIVHVYGKAPTDPNYEEINLEQNRGGKNFAEVIKKYNVGGVIYYNWNDNVDLPVDPEQVNALSNGLQEIVMDQEMQIPLFISTDQEGGIVQRVTSPATVFPGNMALGATRSTLYAKKSAAVMGTELQSLGINMNFAPVADVNVNPANPVIGVRSFGEDPKLVSDMTVAQVEGYQEKDVIATAKHFPGHGDTAVDSHYGLPIINHDLETLHEVDLKPFKAAIDAGIDAIMTAHIVVPALDDSGLPATLSKPILTGLLREEMNFEGVIITDSLGMAGANILPPGQSASVTAFKAGADILLNPPNVPKAYNEVLDAVKNGEISKERLNQSVYRILELKMKRGLFQNPYTDPGAIEKLGTEEHLALADEIANKSITLVKNEDNVLPLNEEQDVQIVGPSSAKPDLLSNFLNEKGFETDAYQTSTSPTDAQIDTAVEKAQNADKVIVTTYTANTNSAQQKLVDRLIETGKPVIATAIRNPYDLMVFPEVVGYLATYGYQDVSIKALGRVIAGDINPSGELPVTIPDLYEYGHGLDYVSTPLSAEGMKTLVGNLQAEGEIDNDGIARALTMHLTAVSLFERQASAEKVVKHMEGFKRLLDHQQENGKISGKAHSFLETEADQLIEKWSKDL